MLICIDLGSNTLRIALMEQKNGVCYVKKSFERIVGSARGLKEKGEITKEAKERIFGALSEALNEFDFKNLKHLAVATAAFRIAKNSDEIFKQIRENYGINFNLISGESEAKFINLGVLNALDRLKISSQNLAFIDLGGASSEISGNENFRSFNFGIITFFESYKTPDLLEKNAKNVVKEAKEFLNQLNVAKIVLTSGVATTMASLKLGLKYDEYDANKINGTKLEMADFSTLRAWLLALDDSLAVEFVGINRQMLVVAGMSLLKELLSDFNGEILAIDDGLREGLGVAYFKGIFDKILKFHKKG